MRFRQERSGFKSRNSFSILGRTDDAVLKGIDDDGQGNLFRIIGVPGAIALEGIQVNGGNVTRGYGSNHDKIRCAYRMSPSAIGGDRIIPRRLGVRESESTQCGDVKSGSLIPSESAKLPT